MLLSLCPPPRPTQGCTQGFSWLVQPPQRTFPPFQAAQPHPAPAESQILPPCTKRIHSLSKFHFNFTSPAAPAPPPASPAAFVPGETPKPTTPRAASPQLPQPSPLGGQKEKKNQEWLCPDVLHNLSKSRSLACRETCAGQPRGAPNLSAHSLMSKSSSQGRNPPSPRRGWPQVGSLLPPARGGDTNQAWRAPKTGCISPGFN